MFTCSPLPETATPAMSWSIWTVPSRPCWTPCAAAGMHPVWYSKAARAAHAEYCTDVFQPAHMQLTRILRAAIGVMH
jgi:hypothetical protein